MTVARRAQPTGTDSAGGRPHVVIQDNEAPPPRTDALADSFHAPAVRGALPLAQRACGYVLGLDVLNRYDEPLVEWAGCLVMELGREEVVAPDQFV